MNFRMAQFGIAAALAAGLAASSAAQTAIVSSGSAAPPSVLRVLDDPSSGARWLLLSDPAHPGGPGRLVRAAGTVRPAIVSAPVLRAGDRLVVEEHTPLIDARLEAIALGPAAPGAPVRVRLLAGGRVVRVLATGPGRALLAPDREDRP